MTGDKVPGKVSILADAPIGIREKLQGLFALDRIYAGYEEAARQLSATGGIPLCIDKCGKCCSVNVLAYGIEAEYMVSWLLGKPELIKPIRDACREWLTRPEPGMTFGKMRKDQEPDDIWREFIQLASIMRQPCPMLDTETKRCRVHPGRPTVCRAYGVTHVPAPLCPRPRSKLEPTDEHRIWWSPDQQMPHLLNPEGVTLRQQWDDLRRELIEPRLNRQGFLATLVFEILAADELAALYDGGKIALAKLFFGYGGEGHALLWQDQLDREWSAVEADKSIEAKVPLAEENGRVFMRIGKP